MKKLILVLLSVTMLQGCFYQVASNIDIKKAILFCGGVDKIHEVSIQAMGVEVVKCTDTRASELAKVKLYD